MPEFQITGPPGCGKTTYLATQAARAAEAHGGANVLAMSLTKAAASEFGGRHAGVQFGTMHSVCFRALALGGKVVGDSAKGVEAWNERPNVRRNHWVIGDDEHKAFDPDDPLSGGHDRREGGHTGIESGDDLLRRLNITRHRLAQPRDKMLRLFDREWKQHLADLDSTDFTGMIELCYHNLSHAPGQPDVMLGDEGQDYSKLEIGLFRKWSAHAQTSILCADPDQAIYVWRGADPRIFLDHEVREDQRRILSQSYRVPRAVHAVAQRVIRRIGSARADVDYLPRDEDGSADLVSGTWRRPEHWIDRVLKATDEGTVMILASCAYMLGPLVAVLRHEGVPFQNKYRRKNGAWNPLHSQQGGAAHRQLLAFLAGGEVEWSSEDLSAWVQLMPSRSTETRRAMLRVGAKQSDFSEPWTTEEYERLWLDPADGIAAFDKKPAWLLAHCMEKHAHRLEYASSIHRRLGVDGLKDEPKIDVGTIHSVKGGEADHVFVINDLSLAALRGRTADIEQAMSLHRLFYVAVTRARRSLTIIDCGASGYGISV